MTSVEDLVGTWLLSRWDYTVDGELRGFPMGEDALGQILYQSDGWMSAILMRSDRAPLSTAQFHQASADEREVAALTYVSYGGTYDLRDEQVHHHVAYSLFPNWIGTDLVREVSWDGDRLVLTALPETTGSGRTVVNRLVWRRP